MYACGLFEAKYLDNWELLTIHNMNRHFPESEETQKGHMRNKCQGVLSNKSKSPHKGTELPPVEKNLMPSSIYMKPGGEMYTDQTGKLPHRLICGNRYQMILHEIDGNSTCIETMKNKTEG